MAALFAISGLLFLAPIVPDAAPIRAPAVAPRIPDPQPRPASLRQQDGSAPETKEQPTTGPREITATEARELLKELRGDLAAKELSPRLLAIDRLAKVRNSLLVKPLIKQLGDRQPIVRSEAARALGSQADKTSRTALLKALSHPINEKSQVVREAIVLALGKTGYPDKAFAILETLFDSADEGLKKALIITFGAQKDPRAFPLLIEWIDKPEAQNPADPHNPPASWWRARWQTWQKIRLPVLDTLQAITGKRFTSREEAVAWSRTKEAKKRKISPGKKKNR